MKEKSEDLLNQLINQISSKEELDKLKESLFKRGVETLLKAEMNGHLGYPSGSKPVADNQRNGYSKKTLKTSEGDVTINVPRDRNGTFDPLTVPKHKTMSETIEDSMISLYAKGMSNADIVQFIEETYGVQYSTSQVSLITNTLLEDIKEWQQRPLDDQYAVLWIDAIHYKIRHEGKVVTKACMVALGIGIDGRQDILGLYIVQRETAATWMGIFNDLKHRGVQDILFLCSDNLTGLQNAVKGAFPNSTHQICIVHQIRNSLKYVNYKDRKKMIHYIKSIYQASDEKAAHEAFTEFKQDYGHQYAHAVKSWEENWDALTAFLDYPQEIRKLIYTTNIIESFNASLRKHTKNKKVFPNDDSALKSIYLAAQNIRAKWKKARFNWTTIYNQLYIYFEDRIIS